MGVNIAIDGPSGAGKSTIAKAVAKKMQYVYVDTGALYRTVALHTIRSGIDVKNTEDVVKNLENAKVNLGYVDGTQRVFLNGEDVSELIRTSEISMGASAVSAVPEVRKFLFDLQHNIAKENNILMDGRDIGTVVLPNADVKIFLTASAEKRAERRFKELEEKGENITYQQVLEDIIQRDYNDTHREIAPLKKAQDAVEVDSSDMTLEEVVECISNLIEKKLSDNADNTSKPQKKEREMMPVKPIDRTAKLGKFSMCWYSVARFFVNIAFRLWYKIEFVGKENIPQKGGYIFASTHRSYADPVLLGLGGRVPLSFMAKEELFQGNKFFKWLITSLGAFPVKRGKGDTEAIEMAFEVLNRGKNLIIFPEGTRSKDGKVGKIKTGVALISAAGQVPVVPTAIIFDGKLKFRKKIILAYAPVIDPMEIGVKGTSTRDVKILKTKISEEINRLVNDNVNKL